MDKFELSIVIFAVIFLVRIFPILKLKYQQLSDYDKPHDGHDSKSSFNIWDCLLFVPVVLFVALRFFWWPMHKEALDVKVGEMINYDTVWYNPDYPGVWAIWIALFVAGIYTLNHVWRNRKEHESKGDKLHYVYGMGLAAFCMILASFYFSIVDSKGLTALYIGRNQVAFVDDWQETMIVTVNLDDIICKKEKFYYYEKKKGIKYYLSYTIHPISGKKYKIIFDTDSNYSLLRFHLGEVRCDRLKVLEALDNLSEYEKAKQ